MIAAGTLVRVEEYHILVTADGKKHQTSYVQVLDGRPSYATIYVDQ